jgi:hypothetical protein
LIIASHFPDLHFSAIEFRKPPTKNGRQVASENGMMTSLTLFEVALFPTNKSVFLQEILMFPDPNMLFCSMPKSQSVRIPWENVKKIAQLQN